MFPCTLPAEDRNWQPGPYPGVELILLNKDETTGALTVLRKFKAGTRVPAHTHPQADESVYVLEGQWGEEDVFYGPGTFFFVPKGQKHGPHFAHEDVISLTIFSGPLTVVDAP